MTAGLFARLPPLVSASLAYACGAALVLAPGARVPHVAGALALAAACGLLALRGARYAAAIGWLLVGVGATAVSLDDRARDCRFDIDDRARVTFRGTLTTMPAADGDAYLRIEESDVAGGCTGDVRARVRLRADAGGSPGGPGDRAGGSGRTAAGSAADSATPPMPGAELRGSGRWMQAGWVTREPAYAGTLFIDDVDVLAEAGAGHHPLLAMRGAAQRRVRELFGERAPVVEALVLARMEGIDPEVRDRYARSGLAHLLSISGTHVGLIAGLLMAGASAAGFSAAAGSSVAIVITWAYVLFLGAPAAAARSALMLTLFLAARLLQRPARASAILAASGVVLVAWDPGILANAGFQLSFAGMIGLIALAPPLGRALPARLPGWLRDGVAGGVAATLATAPVSALHFQQVAPIGVLANLVAVPAMAVAVPAIGVCLAVGVVSDGAASFLAGGTGLLVDVLDRTAGAAAAVPYGHAHVTADLAIALVLAGAAAAAAWRGAAAPLPGGRGGAAPGRGVRRPVRRAAAAATALAVLVAWPAAAARGGSGALEVHVIDVGQGDAIAIRTPHGAWLLVDAGPRTGTWDAGARTVAPYLLRHGVRRIEALVVTHPDADHIGGVGAVESSIPVARIVDPGRVFGKEMHAALLADAAADGRTWLGGEAGRALEIDGVRLEILHPSPAIGDWETNELSVVMRLEWRDFTMMLTGDAGAPAERAILEHARRSGTLDRLDVDVLKVGHHGSRSSTTPEFLAAVRPELAVIPVGRNNRYGHPHPTVVRRLEDAGIDVLRTDRLGDVVLVVRPFRPPEITTAR
ncbi:MAG TPA: ComEC/Rec2 family competence protein [Longimicrobiales bacterium]